VVSRAWLASSLASVALVLGACSDGKGEDRPSVDVIGGEGSVSVSGAVEGYGDPLYFPATDQAMNHAIGSDLRDLRAIMSAAASGNTVDWAAATALYDNGKNQHQADGSLRSLASLATQAPSTAFPGAPTGFIDQTIRSGLTGTGRGAGLSDNARRQLVDKGVQVLMYGLAMDRLALADQRFFANGPNVVATIDEAWAILSGSRDETTQSPNSGLLATGIAREEDYKLLGRLSRPLESALLATAAAAERKDNDAFEREIGASRSYLNTIMYLSVLRYAKVLESDQRASDREFHLAEAWTFFQALKPVVSQGSMAGANAVEQSYSQSPETEFTRAQTQNIYGALNHPEVLKALGIPPEFQFATVPE
jgi:hypothetical protein